jgi:hypothetical protein
LGLHVLPLQRRQESLVGYVIRAELIQSVRVLLLLPEKERSLYPVYSSNFKVMDFPEKKSVESPEIRANPFSKFFFCWIVNLFRKGAKEDLVLDDLYDRLPEDDAGYWGATLERYSFSRTAKSTIVTYAYFITHVST